MIKWPDLSAHDAKMFACKFAESDTRFIMVELGQQATAETRRTLKKDGFFRIGGYFFKAADRISAVKVKEIFPLAVITNVRLDESRVLVDEAMPAPLRSMASGPDDRPQDGFELLNGFQAKYQPKSKLGSPIAAIPLPLAKGTMEALERIYERYGDIDEWVCNELKYESTEAMAKVLSPEQIDAVGLAISEAKDGVGAICADQTGLGKGRVGAALARWSTLNGRLFVFLTEKANLFTDFIRDIIDIDALDLIGTPYLMNDGARILDQATNDVLFKSLSLKENKEVIKTSVLPEGTQMVMATYSQLNREGSAKSQFFAEICKNAHIHADESHNAAGEDSNTSKAVDQAMLSAASYSYSSATHAKRASNMAIYSPILPDSLTNLENMVEVLDAGGSPLLEALSRMLAETGRLVRREHDLSGMHIDLKIDEARKTKHEQISNDLAPILSMISRLNMDIGNHLEEKSNTAEAQKAKERWYTVHWGVRFSSVIDQFIAACKVDMCVDHAVEALRAGEKPIIVFKNTMESILREIATDEDGEVHDLITGDDGKERLPEFKDVLELLIDRTMTARYQKGKQDPETIDIDEPEFAQRASEIKNMIKHFPNMPISPMDSIMMGIEEKGKILFKQGVIEKPWVIGEISARKLKVDSTGITPMAEGDRNVTINDFQNGALDGLLLTKAASTGLSLHENPRSPDERVRHMMEFQIPPNPVERVQFWGRVKRRGGRKEPKFSCLASALSIELRSLAAQNRKVEMLSANVSGSTESAIKLDVVDPINALGNKIAKTVLQDNPQLAFKMGISLKVDDEQAEEELYYVNRILSRQALIKSDARDAIHETFMDAYNEALADLASKGIHPTKARELPGEWRIVDREVFEAPNPADGPVFGKPVYLTTIERENYVYPLKHSDVCHIIEDRYPDPSTARDLTDGILEQLKKMESAILKQALPKRYTSVIAALHARENNMVKVNSVRISGIKNMLSKFHPGGDITASNDHSEAQAGIVTGIRTPSDPEEYGKPGSFFLEYVLPGDETPRRSSFASLFSDEHFKIGQHAIGSDVVKDQFSDLKAGKVVLQRMILDGNPLMAAKAGVEKELGSSTRIKLETGEILSAVLIPPSKQDVIRLYPGNTTSVDVAWEILRENGNLHTHPKDPNAGMKLERDGPTIRVTIPGKKSLAKPFDIPEITDITGELKGDWRGRSARIGPDQFEALSEVLRQKGLTFNFPGRFRELALAASKDLEKTTPQPTTEL